MRLRPGAPPEVLPVVPAGPLGFDPDIVCEPWTGRLAPGETLLLYTDGVTEAFDAAQQAFGEARLHAALDPGRAARAQCEALVAAVHAFAGAAPQSDDITVLAMRLRQDHRIQPRVEEAATC